MLLNFSQRSCHVVITQFHWRAILDALAESGYRGLIAGLKDDILDRFGVESNDGMGLVYQANRSRFGDLFFPDGTSTVFLKISRTLGDGEAEPEAADDSDEDVWADPGAKTNVANNQYRLDAGEVIPLDVAPGERLDAFLKAVNKTLIGLGVQERALVWNSTEAERGTLPFAAKPAEAPDARSLELATVFRDGRLGHLVEKLAQTPSFTIDEYLASVPNREETEYYIDKLFEMEFLAEEIVVYSRTTGAPVIRAKDRAALKALSDMGITSAEGRPLEDEDVRRLITLPPANKSYVSGTWAARTFLVNVLLKMGYGAQDIHIAEHDGELDILHILCGDSGVVFALSPAIFSEKNAKELWKAVGKSADYKLLVFGAKGMEDAALNNLMTLAGKANVFSLSSLEDFSAAVVDAINNERTAQVRRALKDLDGQLTVDLAGLVAQRGA